MTGRNLQPEVGRELLSGPRAVSDWVTSGFRGHTGLWVALKELGKFSVGGKEENSTLALLSVSGKRTQGNLIPGLLGTQEVIKAKG